MSLQLVVGQHSMAGRKPLNQDCADYCLPAPQLLCDKGAVLAIADGIGSSQVSHIASETAVRSFLLDYYCTNPAWSVRHAALQVLHASHRWLYQQNRHSSYGQDPDKGYCCTFSALILRQQQAHLLHVGDSRIYLYRQQQLIQLTRDHRAWQANQHLLSQALGAQPALNADYDCRTIAQGDLFLLATDGLFEHLSQPQLLAYLQQAQFQTELNLLAQQMATSALANGSADNISVQLVRIDSIPLQAPLPGGFTETLPLPPLLTVGQQLDGLTVVQVLSQSSRSHLYQVRHRNGQLAVLKAPSQELAASPSYLERLLREEWIANRVLSPFVLKAARPQHSRTAVYSLFEYVGGQTLLQWREQNPLPTLDQVLQIIEQTGKGLQALHRAEILHQDIRPQNILLDTQDKVRIIDFGAARLAGLQPDDDTAGEIPGTALYCAPEYFVGRAGTTRSDLYSLAVLCYYLLTGRFPYGPDIARCKSVQAQKKLSYQPIIGSNSDWPEWLDLCLQKALQVEPEKRYQHLSEFLYDLRHPNPALGRELALQAANPIRLWQALCYLQSLAILLLLVLRD